MNKNHIITIAAACALWLLFTSYSRPASEEKPVLISGMQAVALPPLPESLSFAGEKVPLENFDTRESLQREMLTTAYMHSRTSLTLLNSRRYFAIIEPILAANGIPDDFKYLCMAESGLDPEAVSAAGAGGLWQIMKGTGKDYGLEVSDDVDERFHLEKSTDVACKYLLESYGKLGSWTLAAAAYNAGRDGVAARIGNQGTDSYYDTFFPQETLRYVFRILSLKIIAENPSGYGFMITEKDYYPPFGQWREAEASGKPIRWNDFAAENGTTFKMLRMLNPWIRSYEYANRGDRIWTVKVPSEGFREASR